MTNVFVALILAGTLNTQAVNPQVPMPHLRTTERFIREAIAEGIQRSPSFRRLLDRLDASDLIVHAVWDLRAPNEIGGHLAFVADAHSVRYLRISVSRRLSGVDLVSLLGHELAHACEIADRSWVVDRPTMAALYAAIGARNLYRPDNFDTTNAVDAGDRIRLELTSDAGRTAAAGALRLR